MKSAERRILWQIQVQTTYKVDGFSFVQKIANAIVLEKGDFKMSVQSMLQIVGSAKTVSNNDKI
jgi:hypothetical protein